MWICTLTLTHYLSLAPPKAEEPLFWGGWRSFSSLNCLAFGIRKRVFPIRRLATALNLAGSSSLSAFCSKLPVWPQHGQNIKRKVQQDQSWAHLPGCPLGVKMLPCVHTTSVWKGTLRRSRSHLSRPLSLWLDTPVLEPGHKKGKWRPEWFVKFPKITQKTVTKVRVRKYPISWYPHQGSWRILPLSTGFISGPVCDEKGQVDCGLWYHKEICMLVLVLQFPLPGFLINLYNLFVSWYLNLFPCKWEWQ